MNTLIIIFNKYNKNIVFRDCQIFIEKKGDPFGFLPSSCWTPCQQTTH